MTTAESTKIFFEQAYSRTVADEEVAEYKETFIQFFSLLIEIDKKQKEKIGRG